MSRLAKVLLATAVALGSAPPRPRQVLPADQRPRPNRQSRQRVSSRVSGVGTVLRRAPRGHATRLCPSARPIVSQRDVHKRRQLLRVTAVAAPRHAAPALAATFHYRGR